LKLKFIWRIKKWQKQLVVSTRELLIFPDLLRSLVKEMELELSMPLLLAMGLVKSIGDKVRVNHGIFKP
jgi:hypothetical protein